jgi:phosphopantothenoylcysteine synthetase/decarboxylase
MKKKNCDMMIANAVESAMETDATAATIICKDKPAEHIASSDKRKLAEVIVSRIAQIPEHSHE